MIQYVALILMLIGIYGLLINRNVIKIVVSLNILEVGLNIFIIASAYVKGGRAPILTESVSSSALSFVDPLPHALVLTAIVIGVGTTALGLAIARKLYQKYGTFELNEMGVEE